MRESKATGIAAVSTVLLLLAALLLAGGGPETNAGNDVILWFRQHPIRARAAAVVWLAAMLMWVAFAVRFRDAVWLSVAERPWVTSVFVQGAVVFSTIVTIAAAGVWALAGQVSSASADPAVASALWAFNEALLRFAAWGLCVPVLVVAAAIRRRSRLGAFARLVAVPVVAGLVVSVNLVWGLLGFTGWLGLVALTMFRDGASDPQAALANELR